MSDNHVCYLRYVSTDQAVAAAPAPGRSVTLEYVFEPADREAAALSDLIDLAESLNCEVVIKLIPKRKVAP